MTRAFRSSVAVGFWFDQAFWIASCRSLCWTGSACLCWNGSATTTKAQRVFKPDKMAARACCILGARPSCSLACPPLLTRAAGADSRIPLGLGAASTTLQRLLLLPLLRRGQHGEVAQGSKFNRFVAFLYLSLPDVGLLSRPIPFCCRWAILLPPSTRSWT